MYLISVLTTFPDYGFFRLINLSVIQWLETANHFYKVSLYLANILEKTNLIHLWGWSLPHLLPTMADMIELYKNLIYFLDPE